MSGAGSSGAGPFRARISYGNAARDVQGNLQQYRRRQEQQARLEWQNEDPAHRLKKAEENNEGRQVLQIETQVARSAKHESDRGFLPMPIPQGSFSSPAEA